MMRRRRLRRSHATDAAVVLAVLFWLIKSAVDAIFFHPGPLFSRLFPIDDPHELWMRWLMVAALLSYGAYAQRLLKGRRRAEEALHTSDDLGAVVLRSIGDGVIATDVAGRVTFQNAVAQDLTGWPVREALGKPIDQVFRIINEQTRRPAENPVHRVVREGVVVGLANHSVLIGRDGTERPIADSGAPVRHADGRIAGAVLVFRDVTEERRARQEIESLARFPSENPFPVLRVARDGTIVYANAASAALLRAWQTEADAPAPPVWQEHVREALDDGKPQMVEERVDDRVLAFVLAPLPQADYANLYGRDVTDRRRAEERVRELNALLRAVRNVNQLIARETDRDRLLTEACNLLLDARGYLGAWIVLLKADGTATAAAEAGVGPATFAVFADRLGGDPRPLCIQRALDEPGVAWVTDPRATCRDCPLAGRYAGQSVLSARLEHDATVYGVLCVALEAAREPDAEEQALIKELADDIAFALENLRLTEQHRRDEAALRTSEEKYRFLIENASDMIYTLDREGCFTYVNPRLCHALGYAAEELMGRFAGDVVAEADQEKTHEAFQRRLRGEDVPPYEFRVKRRDGTILDVEIASSVVRLQEGEIVGTQAVLRDITERKRVEAERARLEEQLRQASKMEAIGQLAGGIAHDFNNLLTGILGHANLLKLSTDPDSAVYDGLKTIERAAEQAADLTRQLLGFARGGKHQIIPVDLNQTVGEAAAVLDRTIEPGIAIVQHLRARPAAVQGDPVQMQQVVLNLAINARDAMPDGGTLTIATDRVELDEEAAQTRPSALPGTYVVLAVKDTGVGIPDDIRDHIFEPFFTTKEPGIGTGMGLATVYGIVTNHGGWVDVESEVGCGTTFTVYLPAAESPPDSFAGGAPGAVVSGAGGVLLVDDEAVIRDTGSRMLKHLGYRAVTASDGCEALDYYRAHAAEVDLIILDLVMPKMGARECFRRLKELNPHVRVVLSTGYGLDGAAQAALDEGMVGFVQKPYRISQLSQVVARALRGES